MAPAVYVMEVLVSIKILQRTNSGTIKNGIFILFERCKSEVNELVLKEKSNKR